MIKINKQQYILSAAILFLNGNRYPHQPKNIKKGFVLTARRHYNIFNNLSILNVNRFNITNHKPIQGFITNDNLFVNRKQAAIIALNAKQISQPKKILFSEDLY